MTWDGNERRVPVTEPIEYRMERVEESLEDLHDKVQEIRDLLTQGEGIAKFLKFIVLGAAPLLGLVMWLREHVKLN